MTLRTLSCMALAVLLPASALPAVATGNPHHQYKFDLPPSADLNYAIKGERSGITLRGEGVVQWRSSKDSYSINTETRAMIVGKIHSARSEGVIDRYGLAPVLFYEKRFRKQPLTVAFERDKKTISFSLSDQTYPIRGGEQDRTSAIWQLAAIARGAQNEFKPGSTWTFFVAGRTDGEPWVFKVLKQETVRTPLGNIKALHVSKLPPPDSRDRKTDIWLAPSLEWYPVKIRYSDEDTDSLEQTLQAIERK